jgi:hypothetical protein
MAPSVLRYALLLALAACSAEISPAPPGAPAPGADPTQPAPVDVPASSVVWSDKEIGLVEIPAGLRVTIAPGARLSAKKNAKIVVKGTLVAQAKDRHAILEGADWGGIVVAAGGRVELEGVDIKGGDLKIEAGGEARLGFASFESNAPFTVDAGGKLSVAHLKAKAGLGQTTVNGAFVASYLEYDSSGNEGIVTEDPEATVHIEDARMYGIGSGSGDMIVSYQAKSIEVVHSDISKVHCALQFHYVSSFDVSFTDMHTNGNSLLIAGSPNGTTKRIASSNLRMNTEYGISQTGDNGIIEIAGCYFGDNALGNAKLSDGAVTITGSTDAPVAGTGPR